MIQPDERFLRQHAVAALLGVHRHVVRKLERTDPDFPVFFELSPGIRVCRLSDLSRWIKRRELLARMNRHPATAD